MPTSVDGEGHGAVAGNASCLQVTFLLSDFLTSIDKIAEIEIIKHF